MFREMRRKRQQLSDSETSEILKNGSFGVLALCGDDGYPYAVPVSYVYADGTLYFHGAKAGHKFDAVQRCDKSSFCVTAKDDVQPEKYTTYYKSAVAFGRISVINDADEARQAISLLGRKYFPEGTEQGLTSEIEKSKNALCLMKLEIEHLTGKQAKELC